MVKNMDYSPTLSKKKANMTIFLEKGTLMNRARNCFYLLQPTCEEKDCAS